MLPLIRYFTSMATIILQLSAEQKVAFLGDTANLEFFLGPAASSALITWQKGNEHLLNHDLKPVKTTKGRYSSLLDEILTTVWLEISDITFQDAGNYSCIVYKQFKGTPVEYEWTLLVQGSPYLSLDNNTSNEFDHVKATCCTNRSLSQWNVQFVWMIGKSVGFPRNKSQTSKSCRKTNVVATVCSIVWFQSVRQYNLKQLVCFLGDYSNKNSSEILQVIYVPVLQLEANPSPSADGELFVYMDQVINITCIFDGQPETFACLEKYEKDWINIQNATSSSASNNVHITSWNFHVRATNTQSTGRYRCLTISSRRSAHISNELRVVVLYPLAVLTHSLMKVANSHNLVMSCKISDILTPDVNLQKLFNMKQWLPLKSNATLDRVKGKNTTWAFIFQNATPNLQGTYRCVAETEYGRLVVSLPVVVEIPAKTTTISNESQLLQDYLVFVVSACVCGIALLAASCKLTRSINKLCKDRKFRRSSSPVCRSLAISSPERMNLPVVTDRLSSSSSIKQLTEVSTKEILADDLVFVRPLETGRVFKRWAGMLQKYNGSEKHVQILQPTALDTDSLGEWNCHIGGLLKLDEHRNIISTLGFCIVSSTAYCIQDSTSSESVRSYIRRNFNQLSCDTYSIFELPHRLISFAMDIIRGVKFLNCNKWLHPGLCMDKLLLADDGHCLKLYDFCKMSDAVKKMGTYKAKAENILFLAPEVILKNEYTSKSELWAIAITFWEIFSSGQNVPIDQHKTEHMKIHQKLGQPSSCPEPVYEIMKPCWSLDPATRPSLEELEEAFINLQNEYYCIQFDRHDDKFHKDETNLKGECNDYEPCLPVQRS